MRDVIDRKTILETIRELHSVCGCSAVDRDEVEYAILHCDPADAVIENNYDRIRNMGIEEMASVISNLSCDESCEKYCAYTKDGKCNKFQGDGKGSCIDGIKLWLESEVDENAV